MSQPVLPAQPRDVPWPVLHWPMGNLPTHMDRIRFDHLLEEGFAAKSNDPLGETHALVIIHQGRLVYERYNEGFGADVTCPSWSKAKSITQALVGILVGDGLIDVYARADCPEWRDPADPRHSITLDQLLRMSSGLQFGEDYDSQHPSDVIEMLWGRGKQDVAHFAASFPLAHEPGTFFNYSSGTSNIVSRCAAQALKKYGSAFDAFMHERLFDPLGMTSAKPKFDKAGTFIGSSFCFATPRDFAKFGLLYLRDGIWNDKRLLPEGWVDYARTPTWQQAGCVDDPFGAHWWIGIAGPGSFSANGYEGQYTVVIPDLDAVIVRLGKTSGDKTPIKSWIAAIADCMRP